MINRKKRVNKINKIFSKKIFIRSLIYQTVYDIFGDL